MLAGSASASWIERIVDREQLLQHGALLRFQTRERFVGFGMHADIALQIGGANQASVERAIGAQQRNLGVCRAIFAEAIDGQQQDVGIKLFGAAPDEAEAAHRLIARQRVAGCGLHVFHVAAKDRGKQSGEELRDRADQILLMANHVRRHLRGRGLKKSCGERLARTRARRKMRGGLGDLICERVEIEHLRIGVNRRNAVLVRLRLHVRENVVALLHLHERIADAGAILAVAGQARAARASDRPSIRCAIRSKRRRQSRSSSRRETSRAVRCARLRLRSNKTPTDAATCGRK